MQLVREKESRFKFPVCATTRKLEITRKEYMNMSSVTYRHCSASPPPPFASNINPGSSDNKNCTCTRFSENMRAFSIQTSCPWLPEYTHREHKLKMMMKLLASEMANVAPCTQPTQRRGEKYACTE